MLGLDRIPSHRYAEAIAEGLDRLPGRMAGRLGHVRFVCGVDPVFAGLHSYVDTTQGWSYGEVAHCCYPHNLSAPRDRRTTTIVLPTLAAARPDTVVHELGHALHHLIGFEHTAAPVTEYAGTDRYEAFAEALVARTHYYGDADALHADLPTLALFDALSR